MFFSDIPFNLYWKKGLRLVDTYHHVAPIIRNLRPKLIYLLNGICDVTYLHSRDPWSVALQHPSIQGTVHAYMEAVDQALAQLFSLSNDIGYKPMVLFATLTGVDMAIYNNYPDDLVHPHQHILDNAINAINTNLIGVHKSMSVHTPLLSSAVHMRCRGKFRMASSKLLDGCHPTHKLCHTWAERLYHNAKLNLEQFDTFTLMNHMYN